MLVHLVGGIAALALGAYFIGVWFGWQTAAGVFFTVLGGAMLQRAFASDRDQEPPRSSWREPGGS